MKSKFLTALYTDGWFSIHRSLIEKLGLHEALLLHYLINYYFRMKKSRDYKQDDGWFYCTVSTVQNELKLSADVQLRLINNLIGDENSGVPCIETKKAGLPARRFIRINEKVIESIISEWVERKNGENPATSTPENLTTSTTENLTTSTTENPVSLYSNKKYSNKKISNRGTLGRPTPEKGLSDGNGKPHDKASLHIEDFPTIAAGKLREVLVLYGSDLANARTNTLAKPISHLIVKRGVNKSRIKDLIKWLKEHYDDVYTPKLYKADDFFKRFSQIEDAMKRWHADNDVPLPAESKRDSLIDRVYTKVGELVAARGENQFTADFCQEDINVVLAEMGLSAGSVTERDMP